jgi:hypothetical protein
VHLCFVDESGTPPSRANPSKPYFTLGAAIISADGWAAVARKVLGYKLRHHLRGELKWRYFSPDNQDAHNPMLVRSAADRKLLSMEFAHLIAGCPLTIIASVTDVEVAFSYGSVSDQQDLYHFAYKPITERFQYFLQDQNSQGVIVSDHRGRDSDKMLRAHHDTLIEKRNGSRSSYDRLIEGLFLQDSCHSVGIQIADYVAGAIHRAYCTPSKEHAAILQPRIRTSASGQAKGFGIVEHPKSGFRSGLGRGTPGGAVAPTP